MREGKPSLIFITYLCLISSQPQTPRVSSSQPIHCVQCTGLFILSVSLLLRAGKCKAPYTAPLASCRTLAVHGDTQSSVFKAFELLPLLT